MAGLAALILTYRIVAVVPTALLQQLHQGLMGAAVMMIIRVGTNTTEKTMNAAV